MKLPPECELYETVGHLGHVACKCGMPAEPEAHACPFAEEIHSDPTKICFCCGDCVRECTMEI